MSRSITSLVIQMQELFENQDGTLTGGFSSLRNMGNNNPDPQYSAVNTGHCKNGVCPGSTNGKNCTNYYMGCIGSTNKGPDCTSRQDPLPS